MPTNTAVYYFTPYSLILLASALIVIPAAWMIWPRRHTLEGRYLFLLLLSATIWAVAAGVEAAATTVPLKYLWAKILYLGSTTGPLLYFLFAYSYTQAGRKFKPAELVTLFIIPALSVLAVFTNEQHHWVWTSMVIDPATQVGVYGHGFWYWVLIGYSYLVLAIGVLLLLRAVIRFPSYYRGQVAPILLVSILPFSSNVAYAFELLPLPGMDFTPASFSLVCIVLAWLMLRYHTLHLMPVARSQLVASMQDGVLVLDLLDRIVDANPAARDLLSEHTVPPIGRPAEEVFAAWPMLTAALGQNHPEAEFDLGELTIDVRFTPLYDKQQRQIGRLMVLHDISERKRIENALQEMNASLESQVQERTVEICAEQEKSESILRCVGDAITLLDQDLRIQYANDAFQTLTGFAPSEALGHSINYLTRWEQSDSAFFAMQQTLSAGKTWQAEMSGRRKDGRRFHAALIVTAMCDANGRLVGYVAAHQDISSRRELEYARSQLLNNVSHQFRTPLTNINLYIHLLRSGPPAKMQHYLNILSEQTGRFEVLLQDVLDITALDSGQALNEWQPVELPPLASKTLCQFQNSAAKKGIQLDLRPPPAGLPRVSGDPARLGQALAELLDNAVTFTPAGGTVTLTPGLAVQDDAQWVTLTVSDSGPGIEPEEQKRVFERFYRGRLAETGAIPGTGLGLSIAREILRAHGGRITVESQPGRGSSFTLWLPPGQPPA